MFQVFGPSTNILLSLFGWSVIPDFATKQILNFVYFKSPIRIITVPTPGSLQSRRHYAITFAFVILTYLTYTLVQAARTMQPNFYQILGVTPNVDENGLKLAFRTFVKRNHPDRPEVGKEGEALFMAMRDAFEALKDPVVRFAYDRFGPDVLAWRKTCKTTRDFMYQGFMVSSGYHIVVGMGLLFWSAIGQPSAVSFWRYILFASFSAAEFSLLVSAFPAAQLPVSSSILAFFSSIFFTSTSPTANTLLPSSFSILQTIFPRRVPYQHILFLHRVFMFLNAALIKVVPYFIFLFDESKVTQPQVNPAERALWERIYATLAVADREASIILHTILRSMTPASSQTVYHDPTLARMQPLSPSAMAEALTLLTPEMQALVIEANIKSNLAGPIATAWEAALLKAIRVTALDSDTSLEQDSSNGNVIQGVEKSKSRSPERPSSTPCTSHRSKNFWEKEVVEEVTAPGTVVSESRCSRSLVRKPSTPGSSPVRPAPLGSGEF